MLLIIWFFYRSAFFWFCNDERGKVKEKNPEYGVGDIAKELGRRWAEADPEAKGRYEQMAEKDKARYDKVSHRTNCRTFNYQLEHGMPNFNSLLN